jgi:hypothetical protein
MKMDKTAAATGQGKNNRQKAEKQRQQNNKAIQAKKSQHSGLPCAFRGFFGEVVLPFPLFILILLSSTLDVKLLLID